MPKKRARDVTSLRVFDPLALGAVGVLVAFATANLVAIGQDSLALHQLAAVGAGVILLLVTGRASGRAFSLVARAVFATAVVALVIVLLAGHHANGARRWLVIEGFVVQPSEIAKLGLVLVLADVLSVHPLGYRRAAAAIVLTTLPVLLTLLQPDLSTGMLLLATSAGMLVVSGVPFRALPVGAGGLAAVALAGVRLLRPYQAERLHAFLTGAHDSASGWSVLQAHIAIAAGGLYGLSRSSLHVLMAEYLPARETDLAFASLVEQWGLLAGAAAIVAEVVLIWRLVAATRAAITPSLGLVGSGLALLMGTESILSVAGNVGRLPLAGVPFPFLSYGGTSASVHLAAIGFVLSARRQALLKPLWLPPRWQRRWPRLVRPLAAAISGQLLLLSAFTWQVQTASGPGLRQAGLDQMTHCLRLPAPRGQITDRHGSVLATSTPAARVYAVPPLLLRSPDAVRRLAAEVGTSPTQLRHALAGRARDQAAVEVGEVPAATGRQLELDALPGVFTAVSDHRVYPLGALVAPLLGYVGVASREDLARDPGLPPDAIVGKAGLEAEYDALLRGMDGTLCYYGNPLGTALVMARGTPSIAGADLRVSIDAGFQTALSSRLAQALAGVPGQPPGDEAAAVALDARDGEILAMASLPSYDDNIFGPPLDVGAVSAAVRSPGAPLTEHATQSAAPPGSTFKLVVAAADAAYNAIPPSQVIPTGYTFSFAGSNFHGWGPLPPQDLAQAIAWSNDVYFYKLALALGPDRIHEVGDALGAGRLSGIDLPSESPGFLGTPASVAALGQAWYSGSTVVLGIGQGYIAATPVQVCRWTAAVAGGTVPTPHLGLAFSQPAAGGVFERMTWPAPASLAFRSALGAVREGMRMAVTQGTAAGLGSVPLPVGGKTGTAEDGSTASGGPDAWFTAAAPYDNPEIAVTVFVRGGGEGHITAEPVAGDALAYYASRRAQIVETAPAVAPTSAAGAPTAATPAG